MASAIERLPSLKYVKFGTSDMMVSEVCGGTMMWGSLNKEEKMAHDQLDALVRLGVNFLDSAELYPVPHAGGKVTEEWMGNWLEKAIADGKVKRDKLYIASKANPSNLGAPDIAGRTKPYGFDAESLMASCKASIARMKCQYIDLYYLHWPTRDTPIFGCASFYAEGKERPMPHFDKGTVADFEAQVLAIKTLLDAGLIKYWALSNENNYGVAMFCMICDKLGVARPVCVQNDYSLANRTFESDGYESCHRFGIVSCHYGALAGGVLTGKYLRDSPYAKKDPGRSLADCRHKAKPGFQPRYGFKTTMQASERYQQIAERIGLTPTELALAWAKQRPFVGSVIIGTTTVRQVEECVGAFLIKELPAEVMKEIDEIHEERPNPSMHYTCKDILEEAKWLGPGAVKACDA
ncbi:tas [Symbiodinium natans]|uniref:Tas protein n=1 Tax=Symbiodinium natans TaxID=878477 RepID=A0A812QQM5_9DINO|nr:tas [Symbiodinium natans]